MKRFSILSIIIFTISLMAVLPTTAQNSQKSKSRVAYIRKQYSDAQALAKRTADNMVSVTQREKSEGYSTVTTLDFFYVIDVMEGTDIPYSKLNLLRRTIKGTVNSYEEFLYDPEEENLLFYFYTAEYEKGVKCEVRCYDNADDDGGMLTLKKFTDTKTGKDVTAQYGDILGMPWDEGFMLRFSHDMQEAFNHLTLRGWD